MKTAMTSLTRKGRLATVALVALFPSILLGCSKTGAGTPSHTLDLLSLLEPQEISPGVVDVSASGGMAALESGWHDTGQPEGGSVWAASAESTLFLASSESEAESLEVELAAPGFIPFEFTVDVKINGVSVGQVKPTPELAVHRLTLPVGVLHHGINRLDLTSSHVEAPSSFGESQDERRLGLRFRSARLSSAQEPPGRLLHLRIPHEARLVARFAGVGSVVVQDANTLRPVADMGGQEEVDLDLEGEEGREALISCWGELSSLQLEGLWNPTSVILLISDTLRADAVRLAPTPALDALAEEATVFSHSFSHAPMTLPSHTALFSSRYPHISGVVNNGQQVPQDLPLLADWLSRSGYQTRAVASLGTLWLGQPDASLDRGFRTFQHARGDDSTGEETVSVLESVLDDLSPESPFFLFAHFADPHEPYRDTTSEPVTGSISLDGEVVAEFNAKDGPHVDLRRELDAGEHRITIEAPAAKIKVRSLHVWTGGRWGAGVKREFVDGELMQPTHHLESTFELKGAETVDIQVWLADIPDPKDVPTRYGYEVQRVDHALGELIESLKKRGLWENSLVLFTSDHGEALGDHGSIGHVQTLYDELIHVPLMIKAPTALASAGLQEELESAKDQLIRHIDLTPTILDILEQPPLPGQMGRSILEGFDDPVLLTETHAPEAKRDLYAFRDLDFKLIYVPETDSFQMFDCRADPLELNDVFSAQGDERIEWQELLRNMAKRWEQGEQAEVDDSELDRLKAMGYL